MSDLKRPSSQSHKLLVGFDGTALFRKTDGIGRYTYNLIDSYAAKYKDNSLIIVGFLGDKKESCDLFDKHQNISFHRIPIPRKVYQVLYSRLFRLPVDIFVPAFDAYVSTNFTRYPYITKAPCFTVIHDLAYIRHPEVIERKNLKFLKKRVPKTTLEDNVIAVSPFTKQEIEKLLPVSRPVSIVSNGYSPLFQPSNDFSNKNTSYILTVGTIEPRKNLSTLLSAYAELPVNIQQKYPLKVVGSGGWGDISAPQQKNVTYTGYVSDDELIYLYQHASAFIFPSLYEGFGLPVLEALATNTPVVCSDIPPLRDITQGQATFFDPMQPKSIKNAILHTLNSPKNHSLNLKGYTWEESATQLEATLQSIKIKR